MTRRREHPLTQRERLLYDSTRLEQEQREAREEMERFIEAKLAEEKAKEPPPQAQGSAFVDEATGKLIYVAPENPGRWWP